jgi:hypothetical protein
MSQWLRESCEHISPEKESLYTQGKESRTSPILEKRVLVSLLKELIMTVAVVW